MINVLNKCDRLPGSGNIPEDKSTVRISAKNGAGLDRLLSAVAENLPESAVRGRFLIPYDKGALLAVIRENGKIFSEEYTENGTAIDALADGRIYHRVEMYRE